MGAHARLRDERSLSIERWSLSQAVFLSRLTREPEREEQS
jgi:hypothetical protein